jgi:hypothetical protein
MERGGVVVIVRRRKVGRRRRESIVNVVVVVVEGTVGCECKMRQLGSYVTFSSVSLIVTSPVFREHYIPTSQPWLPPILMSTSRVTRRARG